MNPKSLKSRVFEDTRNLVSLSTSTARSFFLITALIFVAGISFGQHFSVPVTNRISTPYGPATVTTYQHHYMPMYYGGGSISAKYPFTIVLQNDSVIEVKTKIDLGEKEHSLNFRQAKIKRHIKPEDTKEIYRLTRTGIKIKGMPADSCWLFSAVSGKINGYGMVAERGYEYIVAIQTGEGAIVPLTEENLKPLLQGHAKAMKYFEKRKYIQAIRTFNTEDPSAK